MAGTGATGTSATSTNEDAVSLKLIRYVEAETLATLGAGPPELLAIYKRRFADSRKAPALVRQELLIEAMKDAETAASHAEDKGARILRWTGKKPSWVAVVEECSGRTVYRVRKAHRRKPSDGTEAQAPRKDSARPGSPFPGLSVMLAALATGAPKRRRQARKRG